MHQSHVRQLLKMKFPKDRGKFLKDLIDWRWIWRRGWDTHPVSFAILPSFQQYVRKPHGYYRFLRSRLFQLFQSFRINSANFGPKQTPKTPNKTPEARRIPHPDWPVS